MNSSRAAATTLVVVNLLILAATGVFGWGLLSLLTLYWLELVIIGMYNIAKMCRAGRLGELGKSRSYQAIFFIAHYATFCVLYGAALRTVIAGPGAAYEGSGAALFLGVIALLASHGVSFKLNYLDRREFDKVSSLEQMFVPYLRAVPVQVAIVIGAIAARSWGESALALAGLAAVKIVVDLLAHFKNHNALAKRPISPPDAGPA